MKNWNSGSLSTETQGQLVGAGKSLNGGEKIQAKKVKNETFHRLNFFLTRLDFSLPPLTVPGSPWMGVPSHYKTRTQCPHIP